MMLTDTQTHVLLLKKGQVKYLLNSSAMDCLIAMCHVLSLVIFVTSCEQFIGERYAGPGRAGEWAEKGMRS